MKKTLIIAAVLLLAFVAVKSAKAITIEDIKIQITAMISQIAEIQKQIDELVKSEQPIEPKSILVSSPVGGEKWEVGESYGIKWSTANYSPNDKVEIKLLNMRYEGDSYNQAETSITTADNSGTYNWKIPETLNNKELLGSLYKISVSTGESSDSSDNYFTITKPGFYFSPYVEIVFPKGTEVLETGKTYNIRWDYPSSQDYKVDITLSKSFTTYRTLAKGLSNASQYSWTIPQDISGSNYGISIDIYDKDGNLMGHKSTGNNIYIILKIAKSDLERQLASISEIISNLLSKTKDWFK